MWKVYLLIVAIMLGVFFQVDVDIPIFFLPHELKNSFQNKVIWITGASSGIGASYAEQMIKAGATVIISARRLHELEKVAKNCEDKYNKQPYILPLDVTDFDAIDIAYQKVIELYGHIDILVLNAGVSQRLVAVDTPLKITEDLMKLNFISYVALTKLVLPSMITRKQGQIVILSSLSGIIGTPMGSSYSATKFALMGYYNALRSEVSIHDITISIICPGPVVSEISDKAYQAVSNDVKKVEETGKMTTERCTFLMAKAVYYKWAQVWIAYQPLLAICYFTQYFPYFSNLLFTKVIGPSRIKVVQSGGHAYDIKAILGLK